MNIARLIKMWSGIVLVGCVVGCVSVRDAAVGPKVSAKKKLVGWGVNAVDSLYLKEHIRELEGEYALDGMIINLTPDELKDEPVMSKFYKFQGCVLFAGRKFRREDFQGTISELKETKFRRFRENFFLVATSVRGVKEGWVKEGWEGNIEWFDERWSVIVENMALYAQIAKEAGFKGLMLDVEHYQPPSFIPYESNELWEYFNYGTFVKHYKARGKDAPPFEEYKAQVRRQGKRMMEAISRVYPGITIIMIQDTGWSGSRDWRSANRDLVLPFADGILEGLGPEATLVDGGESGYTRQTYRDYMGLRQAAEKGGLKWSRVPELWKKRMRYGFGVWIDYSPLSIFETGSGDAAEYSKKSKWYTGARDIDKNYPRSPDGLEHALYNALTVSDQYVWLYAWHPQWWWNKETRLPENHHRQGGCALCPHSEMPAEYLEVFKNCRRPHDLKWTPVHSGEETFARIAGLGKNIIVNGDFEKWSNGGTKRPDGWEINRPRESEDKVSRWSVSPETNEVKDGACALKLEGDEKEAHIFVDQRIPAGSSAGKTIIFGAWVKMPDEILGDDAPTLSIMDWVGSNHVYTISRAYSGYGTWQFLAVKRKIREGAEKIWFRLDHYPLSSGGAPAYFDGAIAVVSND